MKPHALDAVFNPASIALIGASDREGSIGRVLSRNLLKAGFYGPVMMVNPHARAIHSTLAYASIEALPEAPALAVVAIPAKSTPAAIEALGALGCRAAVVISAGFEPAEADGPALREALLMAARGAGVRLVGPNCLGVLNLKIGLNASFAHLGPVVGEMALVAQSGAIASAALDWAVTRGVGFSKVVTVGDAIDLDVADVIEYLAVDSQTRAILVYVESVGDARKFLSAARFAAKTKPVVLIKGGRGSSGAKAAYSHTGALAASDLVFEAAMRRAGVLQVDTLEELFDAALLVKGGARVRGERLAILTNGGGAAVLATDALEALGGQLATLAPATIAAIGAIGSANWSRRNPVDLAGDARPEIYGAVLAALLKDPGVDAVLALNCPTALVASADTAKAVVETVQAAASDKPVFTGWLGGVEGGAGRAVLAKAALPTFETPETAVRAFMHLVRLEQVEDMLLQTPALTGDVHPPVSARRMVERVIADRRTALSAMETLELLRAYGVPSIEMRIAKTPEEAATVAAEFDGPVALKILSDAITHKTDVGGVVLGLTAPRVRAEAQAMLDRVRAAGPEVTLGGFMIEPMVGRDFGHEVLVGLSQDPVFGPVVLFGQGGVAAEVIADRAIGLPPLDDVLAKDLIGRTRVSRLLQANRGEPAAHINALAGVMVALGRIAIDLPEIKELDINPLLVGPAGVIALDARVTLQTTAPAVRPAIAPYPQALVRSMTCGDLAVVVRPIRADDAPRLIEMVDQCSQADVFLRFGLGMRHLSPELAARLSHVDYDRHMALVAEGVDDHLLGVARLTDDQGGRSGEFVLLVRSDLHGHAIGRTLLQAVIDYAEGRGMSSVWGDTEIENGAMLDLARHLGFTTSFEAEGAMRMTRILSSRAKATASPRVAA